MRDLCKKSKQKRKNARTKYIKDITAAYDVKYIDGVTWPLGTITNVISSSPIISKR